MQRRVDHAEKPERRQMKTALGTILACLALASATGAGAEELGRLFFTPEQRTQLEYSQPQDEARPGGARTLTINGIVQKHGGERTVWINGVPQPAGKSDERSPESVPVAVPGQSEPVKAKVGQKVLVNPAAEEKKSAMSPPQHRPART